MFKCKSCGATTDVKIFMPFKEPASERTSATKYTFHIKQVCFNCHKFNKFLKQDKELMAELKGCSLIDLDMGKRNQ